mmetsp:Transcript_57713/g.172211  ORF Transcript_57713/g.172211 Transcript_57713/m.172211 type:complete len:300 (+) Transcript_57713:838-1737(+)
MGGLLDSVVRHPFQPSEKLQMKLDALVFPNHVELSAIAQAFEDADPLTTDIVAGHQCKSSRGFMSSRENLQGCCFASAVLSEKSENLASRNMQGERFQSFLRRTPPQRWVHLSQLVHQDGRHIVPRNTTVIDDDGTVLLRVARLQGIGSGLRKERPNELADGPTLLRDFSEFRFRGRGSVVVAFFIIRLAPPPASEILEEMRDRSLKSKNHARREGEEVRQGDPQNNGEETSENPEAHVLAVKLIGQRELANIPLAASASAFDARDDLRFEVSLIAGPELEFGLSSEGQGLEPTELRHD